MRISDWSSDVCSSDLLLMSGLTAQQALQRTIEHREIFHDEMVGLMRQIMRGDVSPLMTSAILTGLRGKKETVGEIAAAAQVMRALAKNVERSEERSGGKESVRTCRYRGGPNH